MNRLAFGKSAPVRSAPTNVARMTPIDWLPGSAPMLALRMIGSDELGAPEVPDDARAREVGPAQVGRLDDRGEEARALEVGVLKLGAAKHVPSRLALVKSAPVRIASVRSHENRLAPASLLSAKRDAGQVGALEIHAGQVQPAEVGLGEVRGELCVAAARRDLTSAAVSRTVGESTAPPGAGADGAAGRADPGSGNARGSRGLEPG